MEITNRERDALPFTTKDGSMIREYVHTDRQSLAEATLESGQATQRHYHVETEEIYTLLEGGGRMQVDGVQAEVRVGDSILIPPGAWHQITAGEDGVRFLCCCAPPYADADTYFD
jgi:mannose-6-phosphate isomerase-like protein (cupin superfamily)